MKDEKLRKLLEKVKKIESLNEEVLGTLRKEIFFDEVEGEVMEIFEKEKGELSLQDIAIKLWIDRGGLELKNKSDYYNDIEYFNLEQIVRDVIFNSLATRKGFLDIKRREETQKVKKMFFKKKDKNNTK